MSKGIKFRNSKNEEIYPCPFYPVGSVYIAVSNINPATYFGGKWEQLKDRFLLCAGDTYKAGATGGEATHVLTANEIPSHRHSTSNGVRGAVLNWDNNTSGTYYGHKAYEGSYASSFANNLGDMNTGYTGGNGGHNNMPPYLVVYAWKRVS